MSFDDHYMSPKTGDGISAPSVIVYPDAAKPSKNPFQTNRVWIADADGSGERLILTHLGLFGQVSWLNDETIIYDHDDSAPLNALHSLVTAVSVSTGRSWTITSGYNRQPSYAPVANSNGTKIALRVDPGEQVIIPRRTDLAVETIGNRKVRLYTHYAVVGHSFAWMRDGALLFTDGTGVWRRVEAALPDGRVTTVYGGPGFRDDLALSSDDKYLAWILVQPNLSTFIQVATLHRGTVVSVRTLSQASNPTRGVTSGVTKPFSWRSTDALQLDGYVTYPVGYIAGRRYPLIVLIHGGPWTAMPFWSSEWPGEENFLEYFAQRGFVIFVPDYRASGNFGYDKILRERARHRAMQGDFEDIMSGVDALEQKGIVDPKREAVLGHSYGGVEVNWIITHTRRFKAAVSYEGGIDWYYHWGSQYGSDSYATWKLNGTPFTEPDVYRANSAITYAGYIRTPTLFITSEPGRGAVHWLYAAALSNGVPTEDVIYLDERHVVGKPANQRDLVQRITSWIDRYVLSSGKRR
jgi:dipeptidyl aminopeptidase/acylaminoacyl peptidase